MSRERDLERQPLVAPTSRRHRSYGTVRTRNNNDDSHYDGGDSGFWQRLTRFEMLLLVMFMIAAMLGFLFMILIIINLMHI